MDEGVTGTVEQAVEGACEQVDGRQLVAANM